MPISIRSVLATARRQVPSPKALRRDWLAGLVGAFGSVPDGMASSVLIGVSPVHGLYASMVGRIAGGFTASTRFMVITTTSAAALAAGSALSGVDKADRPGALTLLTLIAGLALIGAGLARLGRYTRFISHSVMTGFLAGISVNIALGQLSDLAGAPAHGSVNLTKALDVLFHPGRIDLASLGIGVCALALVVLLARTRVGAAGAVVALVVPSAVVVLLGLDGVTQVRDSGTIPTGIPLPALPAFGQLNLGVVTGALSVAAIVLVQGAGVTQGVPNPGGARSDANRDFMAQGWGNVAASFFQGQPVGGSVGQTALNVSAGARTRWGAILSGAWLLLILVLFSRLIGYVAQPTLAALLIYAATASLHPARIWTILRTGRISQIALISTFLATLFMSVPAAVGFGVALSLVLQLNREALDLRVVQLTPTGGGRLRESAAPKALASGTVTMLDVYGSLLYAGSRTLEVRLPNPSNAHRAAVVLRLRGRTELGATFFNVIRDYGRRLASGGNRLFLSGVDERLLTQVGRVGDDAAAWLEIVPATEVLGESSTEAYAKALAWAADEPRDDDT